MTVIADLVARLRADTSSFNKGISGATKIVGALGVGLGVAGAVDFLGGAISSAATFGTTMSQLQVATEAPAAQMKELSDLAMKMGADTIYSAGEAADAMLELGKAGMKPATIAAGGLQTSMNLAAAGGLELADAATVTSNAMNVFKINGKDSVKIADALAGAANASSADVADMARAMTEVGAQASISRLSINDTAGALALFADKGMKGALAGTTFKTFLQRLTPQGKKAKDMMADLGLQFYDAQGKIKPLGDIANQLKTKLGGMSDAARQNAMNIMFGSDASKAATYFMEAGAKGLRAYTKETLKSGNAQKMAQARMSGTAGAIEGMRGSLETMSLKVGQALEPAVIAVTGWISKLADWIGNVLIPAVQEFAQQWGPVFQRAAEWVGNLVQSIMNFADVWGPIVAGIAAGAAAFMLWNKAVLIFKKVRQAIIMMSYAQWSLNAAFAANPVGIAIAALVALGTALFLLYKKCEWFRKIVDAVWDALKTGAKAVADWFMNTLVPILSSVWDAIVAGAKWLADFFMTYVMPAIKVAWTIISAYFKAAFTVYQAVAKAIWAVIKWLVDFIQTWVVPAIKVAWEIIATYIRVAYSVYSTVFKAIYAVIKWVIDFIATWVVPAVQKAWNVVSTAAKALWSALTTYWKLIFAIVKWAVDRISAVLGTIWGVVQKVIGFFVSLYQGIVQKVGEVISWLGGLAGKILGAIGNVAKLLWDKGTSIIQGLWNGAKFVFQQVTQWFSQLKDTILGWIGDAGGWLMDVGRQIIQGLINGVKEMVGNLMSTISGIAGNVLDAAKSALGIASPSKKFRIIGRQTMLGWVKGMKDGEHSVAEMAKGVATAAYDAAKKKVDALNEKGREVLDFAKNIAEGMRSYGSVAGYSLAEYDNAMSNAVSANDALAKASADRAAALKAQQDATKGLAYAQEKLNFARSWGDQKQISSAMDAVRKAQDKLTEATQKYADAQAAVGDATSARAEAQAAVKAAAPTAKNIIADMKKRLSEVQQFGAVIWKLRKAGLNNASLQEIIGLGPMAGTQVGKALLGQVGAISDVNKLQSALGSASSKIGNDAALSQFGIGTGQAQAMAQTRITVEKGSVVVNIPTGVTAADRKAIYDAANAGAKAALEALQKKINAGTRKKA